MRQHDNIAVRMENSESQVGKNKPVVPSVTSVPGSLPIRCPFLMQESHAAPTRDIKGQTAAILSPPSLLMGPTQKLEKLEGDQGIFRGHFTPVLSFRCL